MSRYVLAVTAALSIAVIVASAALAIDGRGSRTSQTAALKEFDDDDDDIEPDPSAAGIIAARSQGWLYAFRPDGGIVGKEPDLAPSISASGRWQAGRNCPEKQTCQLLIVDLSESPQSLRPVELPGSFRDGSWSPVSDRLFAVDEDGRGYFVDPASRTATPVAADVLGWEWLATDALVYSSWDGVSASLVRLGEGPARATALNSPVGVFVPSPDRRQLAFAQDGDGGWLVSIVDDAGGVRAAATIGSLNVSPPAARAPEVAISWSPDASMLAVSPVSAPFLMYLLRTGEKALPVSYPLTEGYAGEMKWSPDGSRLAISTYSPDRKHHRVYVLDSPSGGKLRKLMDGCLIFWSPDSRFLVAKPEPYDNDIAAVRVGDGAYWRILASKVSMPSLTPAAWGTDGDDAFRLAQLPARGIGGLGK